VIIIFDVTFVLRQQAGGPGRGAINAYYVIFIFAMLLLHSAVGKNRLWPVRSHAEASLVQKPESHNNAS